jgi:hypothetical protein
VRDGVIAIGIMLLLAAMALPPQVSYAAGADTPVADVGDGTGTVDVADIEIDEYKDTISVDETLDLSVTVLPQNATEQTVTYASGDEHILTVDSKGKVKGVSPGKATVTISVGGMTKRISIKVRETTEYIDVDADYLVLKKGEVHTIKAKAVPGGASQDLSYKSLNPKVAKVTKTGIIKARATGSASILVSNDEMSVGITVIVNKGSAAPDRSGKNNAGDSGEGDGDEDGEEAGEPYAALVAGADGSGTATVSVFDYPSLTAEMLSAIYAANADVELRGQGYAIRISGNDIVNTENKLAADIKFVRSTDGVEFLFNRGHNLPGKVRLTIAEDGLPNKYVYLYNNAKKKYEMLDARDGDSLVLDSGGKYLMADEKIDGFKVNQFLVGVALAVIAVFLVIFIIVKRRYWFW